MLIFFREASDKCSFPNAVIEYVLVKVKHLIFLADFVVTDIEEDPKIPIIFGTSFHVHHCRNMPFAGERGRGSWVRFPKEERCAESPPTFICGKRRENRRKPVKNENSKFGSCIYA